MDLTNLELSHHMTHLQHLGQRLAGSPLKESVPNHNLCIILWRLCIVQSAVAFHGARCCHWKVASAILRGGQIFLMPQPDLSHVLCLAVAAARGLHLLSLLVHVESMRQSPSQPDRC